LNILSDIRLDKGLVKGREGGKWFDDWLLANAGEGIILNDLLFETNNTFYQIDSLFLTTHTIYLFEVKNYEGDFYLERDKMVFISKARNQ
jgi:hypothetical protein